MEPEVYTRPGREAVELCLMPNGWDHQHPVVVKLNPRRARRIAIELLKLAEVCDDGS